MMRLLLVLSMLLSSVPSADLWLAVGYGGRRMLSLDGKTWEITGEWAQPGRDDSNNLMNAVFAQGRFVVSGGGATVGHILTSSDGRTWSEVLTPKGRAHPLLVADNRFVVGISSFPSGSLMWSDDGTQWHRGATISSKGLTHFRGGAYGNGVFVLVGNRGGTKPEGWAITTRDGTSIVDERPLTAGHGAVHFLNGTFVMLCKSGTAPLMTSSNGLDWKTVTIAALPKPEWLVPIPGGLLVGDRERSCVSNDGVTWSASLSATASLRKSPANVLWSDGQRAIAAAWPGRMFFTADGETWVPGNALTANGINVVVRAAR